jgi:hypothetical protein
LGYDVNHAFPYDDNKQDRIDFKTSMTLIHYHEYCFLFYDKKNWNFYCKNPSFDLWKICESTQDLNKEYCFKFGIQKNEIFLVGVRNTKTLQEVDIREIKQFNMEIMHHESMLEIFELLNSPNSEVNGFLVVDSNFNRVLFPTPLYRFTTNLDLKFIDCLHNELCLLEIVRFHEGQDDVVLNHLKQFSNDFVELYLTIQTKYTSLCEKINKEFKKFKEIKDIPNSKWKNFYISMMKSNSTEVRSVFKNKTPIRKIQENY